MGTPELAATGLQALLDDKFFKIEAVISGPDKPVGRNRPIVKSAVKILAEKNNLKTWSGPDIREFKAEMEKIQPDLTVVIAYGQILPLDILNIPNQGSLNVHASLLPKYRGSACLPAPILNGDDSSGLTIMKMDEHLDTGAIIEQIIIPLTSDETTLSLTEKIKNELSKNLSAVLRRYLAGDLKARAQDDSQSSFVKMIKKEDGHINFQKESAQYLSRKIRAYLPWPGTYAFVNKNNLPNQPLLFKILKSDGEIIADKTHQVGELFLSEQKRLALKCHDQALILKEVQLAGKKAMSDQDLLKGNSWLIGQILK